AAKVHYRISNFAGDLLDEEVVNLTDGFITDTVHVSADNSITGYQPRRLDWRRHLVLPGSSSFPSHNSTRSQTFHIGGSRGEAPKHGLVLPYGRALFNLRSSPDNAPRFSMRPSALHSGSS